MARLFSQRFVWPGIQRDCRTWALACQPCQQCRVFRHIVSPPGNFTLPAGRFLYIHVDYTGPLTSSAGFSYCLTTVGRFTRWSEVTPSWISSANTVTRAPLHGWISRFNCPQTTTDQRRQFESQLFHALAEFCGLHFSRTTAHHPASNDLVERLHRTLKADIMCQAEEQWAETLPIVLGILASLKDYLQASVTDLVYGNPCLFPADRNYRQCGPTASHPSAPPTYDTTQSSSDVTLFLSGNIRAQDPETLHISFCDKTHRAVH
jgi:cleavage and polyadenylation specificity factor subunit 1